MQAIQKKKKTGSPLLCDWLAHSEGGTKVKTKELPNFLVSAAKTPAQLRAIPVLSSESIPWTQDFLVTRHSDLTSHLPLSLPRETVNNKTFREESSELGFSVWKLGVFD